MENLEEFKNVSNIVGNIDIRLILRLFHLLSLLIIFNNQRGYNADKQYIKSMKTRRCLARNFSHDQASINILPLFEARQRQNR